MNHYNPRFKIVQQIGVLLFVIGFSGVNVVAQSQSGSSADKTCRPAWMPKSVPDICSWTNTTSLPTGRAYPAAVIHSNKVYVIGGYQWDAAAGKTTYFDDVLCAPITAPGALGTWTTAAEFKNGRSGAGAVVVEDRLIIAGGGWFDGSEFVYGRDVQLATFDQQGNLSDFNASPQKLNIPRSNLTLASHTTPEGTYLYAVAGVTQMGQDTVHLDTVEYTRISPAGKLEPWRVANFDLKGGRSTPQAVVVSGVLYVVGGWGDLDLVDVYDDVQYTKIRSDGTLSPWRTAANRLPSGIYGHATIAIPFAPQPGFMILTVGGQPSTGIYSDAIFYSYLTPGQLPEHTSGPWATFYGMLPYKVAGHATVCHEERLYVIAGTRPGGGAVSDVISARARPGEPR